MILDIDLKTMSDNNELDWEEYESITKYIYEALGAQYGVKLKGHGLLTAIECKYAKKNKQRSRYETCPGHEGFSDCQWHHCL